MLVLCEKNISASYDLKFCVISTVIEDKWGFNRGSKNDDFLRIFKKYRYFKFDYKFDYAAIFYIFDKLYVNLRMLNTIETFLTS